MKKVILAAALSLLTLGAAGTATAGDYGYAPPGYRYITVTECKTVYETRTVPYTKEVTKYDNCGRPYTVCVTCYKQVEVPVKKCCTVRKLVKDCNY